MSPKRVLLFVLVLLIVPALPAVGDAPVVSFLKGEVKKPEGLNEGDSVARNEVIETGADGVVIVEYAWPSEYRGYKCIRLDAFGGGESYTVHAGGTGGRCDIKTEPDALSQQPGKKFSKTDIRYGDAGFDDPSPPPEVARSRRERRAFGGMESDPKQVRSFSGKVTRVTSSEVRVTGKRSGVERAFKVTSSVPLVGARQLGELAGKDVRVDFNPVGFRDLRAVRVEVQSAPQMILHVQPTILVTTLEAPTKKTGVQIERDAKLKAKEAELKAKEERYKERLPEIEAEKAAIRAHEAAERAKERATMDQSTAKRYFQGLARAQPNNATARVVLAEIYLSEGDRDGASAAVKGALEIDDGNARAWYVLGLLYLTSGNVSGAQKSFDKFLGLNPGDSAALAAKAMLEYLSR